MSIASRICLIVFAWMLVGVSQLSPETDIGYWVIWGLAVLAGSVFCVFGVIDND